MPFEEITKEQYEVMLPLLNGINISQIFEVDGSGIDLKAEPACAPAASANSSRNQDTWGPLSSMLDIKHTR